MTSSEVTIERIKAATFYLEGWYTLEELEAILETLKSRNERAVTALRAAMRKTDETP